MYLISAYFDEHVTKGYHFSPFLPSGVLHQLLDLAFEIAGDGDAFFDHEIGRAHV